MKVVQIKHDGTRVYLFETPVDMVPGVEVVVETVRGKSLGCVVSRSIEVPDDMAEYIFPCFTDRPLRKVIGIVGQLGDAAGVGVKE